MTVRPSGEDEWRFYYNGVLCYIELHGDKWYADIPISTNLVRLDAHDLSTATEQLRILLLSHLEPLVRHLQEMNHVKSI